MLLLRIPPRPGSHTARRPRVRTVRVDDDWITVILLDGRSFRLPTTFSRLLHSAPLQERRHWRISGRGRTIRWPGVGETVGLEQWGK